MTKQSDIKVYPLKVKEKEIEERIRLLVNDAYSRGANWACKGRGYSMDTDAEREAELLIELFVNLEAQAKQEERDRILKIAKSKKNENEPYSINWDVLDDLIKTIKKLTKEK